MTLFILNDQPYGSERTYNGLRLALSMASKHEGADIAVFLMGDAVTSAKAGQNTPNGYYNVERMLKGLLGRQAKVLLCGTCMDARGLAAEEIVPGCQRSSLEELTALTIKADKALVF